MLRNLAASRWTRRNNCVNIDPHLSQNGHGIRRPLLWGSSGVWELCLSSTSTSVSCLFFPSHYPFPLSSTSTSVSCLFFPSPYPSPPEENFAGRFPSKEALCEMPKVGGSMFMTFVCFCGMSNTKCKFRVSGLLHAHALF